MLKDHDNTKPMRGRIGDLRNMIEGLNEKSCHDENKPENRDYLEKRNVLRDRGNLLWQNLTALSSAMQEGDKEKQMKALNQAAAALQGFDIALDVMQKPDHMHKMLEDSARSCYAGENVALLFSRFGHGPRYEVNDSTEQYLRALGAEPYLPKEKNDPALKISEPIPAPSKQKKTDLQAWQDRGFELIQKCRVKPGGAHKDPQDRIFYEAGIRGCFALTYASMIKNGTLGSIEDFKKSGDDKTLFDSIRKCAANSDYEHQPVFKKELLGEKSDFLVYMTNSAEQLKNFCQSYEIQERLRKEKAEGKLPKTYANYVYLHSGMNVPKGKEREYLAKCMAAEALYGREPYNVDKIRKEAKRIMKDKNFQKLTKNTALTRKLLMEGDTRTMRGAMNTLERANVARRMDDFTNQRKKYPGKSWEGYLDAHLKKPVPENGREAAQQLMKVMYAISCLKSDQPNSKFSVSDARKYSAKLLKDENLRLFIEKPEAVRKVLASKDPLKIEQSFYTTAEDLMKEAGLTQRENNPQRSRVSAPLVENPTARIHRNESNPEGFAISNK